MNGDKAKSQPSKDKPASPPVKAEQRAGRTGEGARSVLPHLKADQRARAVARIGRRTDPEC